MLALGLALTLNVLAATAAAPDSTASPPAPSGDSAISAAVASIDTGIVTPLTQELELDLSPGRPEWSGSLRARLAVRMSTRRFTLRLPGVDASRVEINDIHGAVPLEFGWAGRDTLLVETGTPLSPGQAGFNIAFAGQLASQSGGPMARGADAIVLEPGAGRRLPAWPGIQPATPWKVMVHAPGKYEVRSNLRMMRRSLQGAWGTWEFSSVRPMPGDSIEVEVRVRQVAPARKHGRAAHRGPPRRK